MRRRLRLMALAISAVAMAAFLVPLALSLKHQQRTNAIASAGQVATDVAALAGKLGADPLRMRNMYSTLYGGGPYTVTLWYPDGSSVPLTLGQPPTVPEDVRQIQRSRTPALRQVLQRADGVSITVTTPSVFGFPGPDDQQATPVTQVVVPTSELTFERYDPREGLNFVGAEETLDVAEHDGRSFLGRRRGGRLRVG